MSCSSSSIEYLIPENVEDELEELQKIGKLVNRLWQREVSLYESSNDSVKDFEEGADTLITLEKFPYHRSLFPLLDIYHLISGKSSVDDYTVHSPTNVFDKKRRLPEPNEVRVAGYLPCSALALWRSLVPPYRAASCRSRFVEALGDDGTAGTDGDDDVGGDRDGGGDGGGELPVPVETWGNIESTDFSFLEEWYYDIVTERLAWAGVSRSPDDILGAEDGAGADWTEGNTEVAFTDDADADAAPLDVEILTFDERNARYPRSDASDRFGIMNLPTDNGLRTKIALKLLKHSLSNLQRDHRLARAALYTMIEFRCFDSGIAADENEITAGRTNTGTGTGGGGGSTGTGSGVDALRYLLAVVHSESVRTCHGDCHIPFIHENENEGEDDDASQVTDVEDDGGEEKGSVPRPDHYCHDWQEFESTIMTIFGFGIDHLTEEHADVIGAFTTHQFEAIGFVELDGGDELLGCWHDDFDVEYLNLVTHTVIGLGILAHTVRYRMKKILREAYATTGGENTAELQAELRKLSSSYRNCLHVLVDIGEQCLHRLPANDQTANLGGYIVCALVTMLSDEIPLTLNKLAPISEYIGNECKTKPLLINPTRYSDLITNASDQRSLRMEEVRKSVLFDCVPESEDDETVREVFLAPVSQDVRDVVRGLFLRQLVDTGISGCGYGDFLTWYRLPVSPFDSMIFEHAVQFPEDDEAQTEGGWGLDEDETESHFGKRLAARYDFTVLMLNRAWNLPWTPQSDASFQPPFRRAMRTLALCTRRYDVPSAVLTELLQYLPRHWWPDTRAECWRYECQLAELGRLLQRKRAARRRTLPPKGTPVPDKRRTETMPSTTTGGKGGAGFRFVTCAGCSIARACSKKHLRTVEGHGTRCGKPPFRRFTEADEVFCREVLGEGIAPVAVGRRRMCGNAAMAAGGDDIDGDGDEHGNGHGDGGQDADSDNDSGEWESIESDEDSRESDTVSKTDLIFRYFDTNSYKLQQFEEPAFANAIDGAYY